MKIKKGDTVTVMTGKDRGKSGKVIRVFPAEQRLIVEGAALQVRHRRPRRASEKGQRVTILGTIAAGNVRLLCGSCRKPTRVGYRNAGAVKQRLCKKCGATIAA